MRGREMAVAVLDQMQMLDEKVAAAFTVAEQRPHLLKRLRIDLTAFRGPRRPASPGAPAIDGGRSR